MIYDLKTGGRRAWQSLGKIIVGKIMDVQSATAQGGGGAEQLSCGWPQEDCFIRKAGRQEYRKKEGNGRLARW